MANLFQSAGLEAEAPLPLAEALRPAVLEDVVGQSHLIGPEGPIGRMLGQGRLSSIIECCLTHLSAGFVSLCAKAKLTLLH